MGLYLNQLPQTEVARLKAELAETLIANFCYPRFYDYRASALRTRPVDRAKRQEVWQYLNAVDFNVWGRVDVDSPEFQRQVERLFIHFVQRNRCFFGQQGRKRMSDVRSLISSRALELADGLRGHLRGQQGSQPFGSPHAVSSWSVTNITGHAEVSWEQILSGTMLLQQQLQEARGEMRPSASPVPSTPPGPVPVSRSSSGSVPARRSRTARPLANGNGVGGNGSAIHEEEAASWPAAGGKAGKPGEGPLAAPFPAAAEISPTLPLALGKIENMATTFQPVAPAESAPALPTRSRRSRQVEATSAPAGTGPFVAPPPSGPLSRQASQPLPAPVSPAAVSVSVGQSTKDLAIKQAENGAAVATDEDIVIFEQMRHQLIIWLRVEAVRAGLEPGSQNSFQLVDILRRQDGVDTARVQVVSTLLNMCDQIINNGKASIFDYKQAMMFYLMHTRRGQ